MTVKTNFPPQKDATNIAHESSAFHVTGEAVYIDDMLISNQLLHGHVYTSPHAHAKILRYDLSKAQALAGVHAVLTYKDIPGHNDMAPIVKDEPVLIEDTVTFVGQAIFLIAADNEEIALAAAALVDIEYELLPTVLSIEAAMAKGESQLIAPPRKIANGDVAKGFAEATHILEGDLHIGGQEHWYLETQVCLCVPGEGDEMKAYSSTQHPSETQAILAEVLGIPKMEVEVQTRRMGGAFGGKETQANHTAAWAALLAKHTQRPVKIRLFRDDDQKMTGKRHPYYATYKIGFNEQGKITAYETILNSDAGAATDLTMAVLERAMMHAENSYYIPHINIVGNAWKTNLPSNTAFRGFGGPQGVAVIEQAIDRIARFLNKDAAEIRLVNFYGEESENLTPYQQLVENNRLSMIWDELLASSEYKARRKAIDDYNAQHEFYKKGMAITPIKFGISFTTSFLNQAGALVHVYNDGTILSNHGGTEMGQGLHTKIKQITALEFGVHPDRVKVNATNTSKVPNTSATAASAGTDLNGMAVKNAVDKLKKRIAEAIAEKFTTDNEGDASLVENIVFQNDCLIDEAHPQRKISFEDAVMHSYLNQISLSATGFYRTPDVHFDRENGVGKPYHYFSFGMAVSEVLLDTLTGHHTLLRADILHDVGESLNARIDIGQVEGAYIQGLGWVTTEECKWDDKGNLLNHSPDTYKIPGIQDIPKDFRTHLLQGAPNPNTIRRSKAVAEPPFMLAFSAWLAIKDAISAVGNHAQEPAFSLPATNEVILLSVEGLRSTV